MRAEVISLQLTLAWVGCFSPLNLELFEKPHSEAGILQSMGSLRGHYRRLNNNNAWRCSLFFHSCGGYMGSPTTMPITPHSPQRVLCLKTCTQYWSQAKSDLDWRSSQNLTRVCLILTVPGPGRLELGVYHSICFRVTAQPSTEGKKLTGFLINSCLCTPWFERHRHFPSSGHFQPVIHPGIALLAFFPVTHEQAALPK